MKKLNYKEFNPQELEKLFNVCLTNLKTLNTKIHKLTQVIKKGQ